MQDSNAPRILGVLLAAGRGRRMQGAKQFEPWPTAEGTKPLVAASFDAVQGVCDEMIVVLGHRANEVATLLASRSFHPVISDADAPMFESIRSGLRAACSLDSRASVLLHPGDHPEVSAATLSSLLENSREYRQRAVIPEYCGQGGHPALIPSPLIELVLGTDCPHGLRQFWMDNPDHCQRIPVDDPSVIRDVDYRLS